MFLLVRYLTSDLATCSECWGNHGFWSTSGILLYTAAGIRLCLFPGNTPYRNRHQLTCVLLYVNCTLFGRICPIVERDLLASIIITINFLESEKLSRPFLQGCSLTVSNKPLRFYIIWGPESKHPCTDGYVVYTHVCACACAHTHRGMWSYSHSKWVMIYISRNYSLSQWF